MNIIINKCIFAYLCLFYSSTKYFHEFQSIFVNFCITDIFVKISTDIFVKSKYQYIRNYRYFVPWQNPDSFAIPCTIGNSELGKALCDSGASLDLMSLSVVKRLSLGELTLTAMTLQMADRSMVQVEGILEMYSSK